MCFWETCERDWREHEEFFSKKISVLQKHIRNLYYFLAFALVVAIARFLKRSTRPAVSMIFSLPV